MVQAISSQVSRPLSSLSCLSLLAAPVQAMEGCDTGLHLLNLQVFSLIKPALVSTSWECWTDSAYVEGPRGLWAEGISRPGCPLLAAPPAAQLPTGADCHHMLSRLFHASRLPCSGVGGAKALWEGLWLLLSLPLHPFLAGDPEPLMMASSWQEKRT